MDALQIFRSPIRLGSREWDTGDSSGAQFLQFELPQAFVSNPTFHQLMLRTYVFYKPDIKVTLQINATPQHMGLLRLWYDPFTQYSATHQPPNFYNGKPDVKTANVFTTSGQPHQDVQASDSSPADLHIRFEHPQTCLTTNSVDPISNMGRIGVMVINPLESAPTSSTSVTVQMWIQFVGCDVAVPIWDHTPVIPALQQSDDVVINMDSGDTDISAPTGSYVVPPAADVPSDSYGPPPSANQPRAWWEKGLGILAGIGGTIWNGVTGNWGGAMRSGIDTVKEIGNLFMDKPSDPMRSVNNMIFPIPPLAHTQGVGGYVRLDAAPIGGYTEIDFSSSDPIEHKLASLMKIPMMIYRFDWPATAAPGTQLMRIPVTPSVCGYDDYEGMFRYSDGTLSGDAKAKYRLRYPTYLSKFSSFFRFWSGSIQYKFQFITTSLHTGKVICTFIPNNYTDPTTQTLPQQTCAQTVEFDVRGQQNFTFSPSWQSSMARKMWYDWTSVSAEADDRAILGWIEIRVTGRLTTTNSIPGTVHCNVWASAGDDFFCETLMHDPFSFPAGYPVMTTIPPPVSFKSEDEDDFVAIQQAGDEAPSYSIAPGTEKSNNMKKMFPSQMTNQAVGDVRDLCRRANYMGIFPVVLKPVTPTGLFRGEITWLNNPVYTDGASNYENILPLAEMIPPNPSQNMMANVATSFVFYSGAIDWTFIPYTAKAAIHLKATYYPLRQDDLDAKNSYVKTGNGSFGSLPAHMTIVSQQGALQVTTPFTSNYQQLAIQTTALYDSEVYTSGDLFLELTTCDTTGLTPGEVEGTFVAYIEVYKAFGDDARFSWAVAPGLEYSFLEPLP